MASKADKWIGKMKDALQPKVDDPVISAMTMQPAGSWGTFGLAQVSGLGQLIGGKQAKKRSGGMPKNVMLAVTDTELIVFEYKPRGTGYKVKDEVARWRRDEIQLGAEKKKMTYLLVINEADGTKRELEVTAAGGDMIPTFLAALGLSAS